MKVKPCCRLIENKQSRLGFLFTQIRSQFYPLVFSTRKCRGSLPHLYVSQSYFLKRFKTFYDFFLGTTFTFFKEFYSLIYGHLQYIVDAGATVFNFEYFRFKAFSFTCFTLECNICHKLHLDGSFTISFTLFASASFDIK